MPLPLTRFQYQSPPNSGGNDGALPLAWVPNWNTKWMNLTDPQIAAFQAFPQDLIAYIAYSRWIWEVRGTSTPGPPTPYITVPVSTGIQLYTDDRSQAKISQLAQAVDKGTVTVTPGNLFPFLAVNGVFMLSASDVEAVYGYVVRYVQSTYAIAATLIGQVQGGQVTTRAPIDAAFAAITVQ
jgi:hypothetical protein